MLSAVRASFENKTGCRGRYRKMGISQKTIKDIFDRTANCPLKFFEELGNIVLEEFSGIRVIGQIERPEGKATYETLKDCLQSVFKCYKDFDSILEDVQIVQKRFRAVLSLYFVWTGVFHYGKVEGHELWAHVFKGLSLPHINPTENEFRHIFKTGLEENNLEKFEKVKEGRVYVTRILLHGLIPNVQLDKFIGDIIIPEFSDIKASYTIGNAIIEKLTRSSLFESQPKPIQRFIKYGYPVNIDVVDKFWRMATNWDKSQDWRQWGLPKYMVDAFHRWVTTPQIDEIQKQKISITGRPHLLFDLEQGNYPLLSIPPQRVEKEAFFKIIYDTLAGEREFVKPHISTIPIDNHWYSDNEIIQIAPSSEWNISILNGAGTIIFEQTVYYHFPESNSGKTLPLFLFNANTCKPVKRTTGGYPDEIIVIYHLKARLDLNKGGGTVLTEPARLSGTWQNWQYIYCKLEKEGDFHYRGPDVKLWGTIDETISFHKQAADPILQSNTQIPSWMRCSEEFLQIITDTEELQLVFSHRRYAFAELIRLDSSYPRAIINRFLLNYEQTDNGKIARVPDAENIEPGVYEIHLHGNLGVEDFTLPFVYFPVKAYKKISSQDSDVADSFIINFATNIPVKSFDERTDIFREADRLKISLKEDSGDAYCTLKIFPDSLRPVVLLFARTDVRWVRHNEEKGIEWQFWRSKPEDIPIHRLDEIQDSRVLIEIDQLPKTDPKILLKDQGTSNEILLADNAKKFKRNNRQVWIINLKQFSDHLKSLKDSPQADIIYNEQILFSLLRFPEFKDFSVKSLRTDADSEEIEITWTPHPNDPRENRKLKFYPKDHSESPVVKKIEDDAQPPVIINLDPPEKAGIWIAEIDIQRARFGISRFSQPFKNVETQWLRKHIPNFKQLFEEWKQDINDPFSGKMKSRIGNWENGDALTRAAYFYRQKKYKDAYNENSPNPISSVIRKLSSLRLWRFSDSDEVVRSYDSGNDSWDSLLLGIQHFFALFNNAAIDNFEYNPYMLSLFGLLGEDEFKEILNYISSKDWNALRQKATQSSMILYLICKNEGLRIKTQLSREEVQSRLNEKQNLREIPYTVNIDC